MEKELRRYSRKPRGRSGTGTCPALEIQYSKQAIKFLKKQDPSTRRRLVNAINAIPDGDIIKMQGQTSYRLRIGDFRVIFDRFGNILYIEKIDNRGQVYKK